jgi:hypothetical protein
MKSRHQGRTESHQRYCLGCPACASNAPMIHFCKMLLNCGFTLPNTTATPVGLT